MPVAALSVKAATDLQVLETANLQLSSRPYFFVLAPVPDMENCPPLMSNSTLALSAPSGVRVMTASNGLPWKFPGKLQDQVALVVADVGDLLHLGLHLAGESRRPPCRPRLSASVLCSNGPCGLSTDSVHTPMKSAASAGASPWAPAAAGDSRSTRPSIPNKRFMINPFPRRRANPVAG